MFHTFTKRRTSELFPTADSPTTYQCDVPRLSSKLLPLTQQYELELRESSAAGAATLLHALGHDWAWREMKVFAMSRGNAPIMVERKLQVYTEQVGVVYWWGWRSEVGGGR